jgi:hypothetical protein
MADKAKKREEASALAHQKELDEIKARQIALDTERRTREKILADEKERQKREKEKQAAEIADQ